MIDIREHGGVVGGGNAKAPIKIYSGLKQPTSGRDYDIWVKIDSTVKMTMFRNVQPETVEEDTLLLLTVQNTTGSGVRYTLEMTGASKLNILQQVTLAKYFKNGEWQYPEVRVKVGAEWKYLSGVDKDSANMYIYEVLNLNGGLMNQFYKRHYGQTDYQQLMNVTGGLATYSGYKLVRHPNGHIYSTYSTNEVGDRYKLLRIDEVTGKKVYEIAGNAGSGTSFVLTLKIDRDGCAWYVNYDSAGSKCAAVNEVGTTYVLDFAGNLRLDIYKNQKIIGVNSAKNICEMADISWANKNAAPTLSNKITVTYNSTFIYDGAARQPLAVRFNRHGEAFVLLAEGYIVKWDGLGGNANNFTVIHKAGRATASMYYKGMAIDGNGDFYLVYFNTSECKVRKVSSTGELIYETTDPKFNGYINEGHDHDPFDSTVIIDKNNNLLVKQWVSAPTPINLFDRSGNLISQDYNGGAYSRPFSTESNQMSVFPEIYAINN